MRRAVQRSKKWLRRTLQVFFTNLIPIVLLITFLLFIGDGMNPEPVHIAILSATYFETSKSFNSPTVVVLFTSQKGLTSKLPLYCSSSMFSNNSQTLITRPLIAYTNRPIAVCRWTPFYANCPVTGNLSVFGITMQHSRRTIPLPFRLADRTPRSVVACFSPLFLNERWQLIITTIEVNQFNGISLQVFYVHSALTTLFNLLIIYQRLGAITVTPWSLVDLDKNALSYDPNEQIEWRNQPLAHTDCLYQYKDSAEFIVFSDIDDFLFPKLAKGLADEFRLLARRRPQAAAFIYDRFEATVVSAASPNSFNLSSLLISTKRHSKWLHGKYAAIPARIAGAWIHNPGELLLGFVNYPVPQTENHMWHFRTWNFTYATKFSNSSGINSTATPIAANSDPPMSSSSIDRIQVQLNQRIDGNWDFRQIFSRLLDYSIYYPLIEACYDEIFYGKFMVTQCPGPIRCRIPELPGIQCRQSALKTEHHQLSPGFWVHFAREQAFRESDRGCKMR